MPYISINQIITNLETSKSTLGGNYVSVSQAANAVGYSSRSINDMLEDGAEG